MPIRSYLLFLTGVFCLFSTLGFINDIESVGGSSAGALALDVLLAGLAAVAWAVSGTKTPGFVVVAVPLHVIAIIGPDWRGTPATPLADRSEAEIRQRMEIIATGTAVGVLLGYGCFIVFVATEGRRYLRTQTEIMLARQLQQALAPPIDRRLERFAFFGASTPSSEVGGDLVDFVLVDHRWTACIADVSGHGVASGTLMATFKSALRSHLMLKRNLEELLADVNRLMFDLKKSSMFITCAFLGSRSETTLEFALAGHLPILHYRHTHRSIDELSVAHLPLGMFEQHLYHTGVAEFRPGDLFALVTDGLTEVFDRHDNEFGLDRLKHAILANAERPLPEAFQAVIAEVRRHGSQTDDQSLLLIRCL